jgi:hypothetical protein
VSPNKGTPLPGPGLAALTCRPCPSLLPRRFTAFLTNLIASGADFPTVEQKAVSLTSLPYPRPPTSSRHSRRSRKYKQALEVEG